MTTTLRSFAGARCTAVLILLLAVGVPPLRAASSPPAPVSAAPTLCAAPELVLLSCATASGKVISLCGSPDLDELRGSLQYRFGSVGTKPELSYPAAPQPAKTAFRSGAIPYSGGGAAYLTFEIGDVRYTVFTGVGKGWEKEGVVVQRGTRRLASLACRGPWSSEIGPELFERLRIPADPGESEFEIP